MEMDSTNHQDIQPSETSLDKQLKQVQIRRQELEAEKIILEKIQIQKNLEKEAKEDEKPWLRRKETLTQFLQILTGVTILGFYIRFLIVPLYQQKNLRSELELIKKEQKLLAYEQGLDSLSKEIIIVGQELESKQTQLFIERELGKDRVDSVQALHVQSLDLIQQEKRLTERKNLLLEGKIKSINRKKLQEVNVMRTKIEILSDSIERVNHNIAELIQQRKSDLNFKYMVVSDSMLQHSLKSYAKRQTRMFFNLLKVATSPSETAPIREAARKKVLGLFMPDATIEVETSLGKLNKTSLEDYLDNAYKMNYNHSSFELKRSVNELDSMICNSDSGHCELKVKYTQSFVNHRDGLISYVGHYTGEINVSIEPVNNHHPNTFKCQLGDIKLTLSKTVENIINL